MLVGKGVLKIWSTFSGEHSCRSAISIKLLCNFIEIVLRHGCSPVNLQHIFRTLFPKYTSGGLLLKETIKVGKFANNWPNLSTWRFIKCNSIHIYNQISCVAIHLKIRVGYRNSRNTIRNPKIDIISTTLDLCVTCL